MNKKILSFVLPLMMAVCTQLNAQESAKLIVNKWKMTHTYQDGVEIKPKHEQLLLTFLKSNEFSITAVYEETHRGLFAYDEATKTITVTDKWTKEEKKMIVKEVTKDHIVIEGFDGEGSSIECVPLSHPKAQHLSHKETLLAKRWTIYKSDKPENLDMVFEFKHDFTFVALPYGQKIPTAQGEWKMSDDHTKVILDMLENGQHLELIINTLHKHELVLHNPESNVSNQFHDEVLSRKDLEFQARVNAGRKEMIQKLDEASKKPSTENKSIEEVAPAAE